MTWEDIQRKRRMAEAMMAQGTDTSPVGSWTQAVARVLNAGVGGYKDSRLRAEEKAANKPLNDAIAAYLRGGAAPGAAAPGASPSPTPPSQAMTTADATPKAPSFSGSQADFIAAMRPHAEKVAAETGLDPRLIIAQSALESAWGKSAPGNNFFGIKSHGQPGGNTLATTEVVNGQPVQTSDSFRAYGGMGDSAADYAAFLKANPRYQGVLGAKGLDAQIEALAKSGYATDPMYGAKIRQIASGIQIPQPAPAPTQVASLDGLPPGPVASDAPPMAYAGPQPSMSGMTPPMPPARPPGLSEAPAAPDAPAPSADPAGPAPQRVAQALMPQAAPGAGPDPRTALLAAALSGRASPQLRQTAMTLYQMGQRDEGVSPVDLGDRIALINKRGQVAGFFPKQRAPVPVGEGQRLVDPVTGREVVAADGAKSPTVQRIKQPDGSEVAVQWDKQRGEWVPLKAPEGGNPVATPKLTEAQSKDVGFYNRGEKLLPRLEQQDKALTEFGSSAGARVPLVGNYLKSDAYRQAEQTGRELLAVILRKDTGAAVTDSEMQLYGNMYLPQPGDDPATIKQKQIGRKTAIEGIRMGLGTADILFKQREALDAAKTAKPAAPASEDGWQEIDGVRVRRVN